MPFLLTVESAGGVDGRPVVVWRARETWRVITCELDFRMHIDRDFIVVVADVDTCDAVHFNLLV